MLDLSGETYLWIKALHIISFASWMAGLWYLPRLFVYHTNAKPGSELSQTFQVMERRLYRAIMTPAMAATWVLGAVLWMELQDFESPWLLAKIGCAVGMTFFHFASAAWLTDFANELNERSEVFYRAANEIPTLLLIAIVILGVLKPVFE